MVSAELRMSSTFCTDSMSSSSFFILTSLVLLETFFKLDLLLGLIFGSSLPSEFFDSSVVAMMLESKAATNFLRGREAVRSLEAERVIELRFDASEGRTIVPSLLNVNSSGDLCWTSSFLHDPVFS